jgi:sugar/nucleoside kinase (ribokinase family)
VALHSRHDPAVTETRLDVLAIGDALVDVKASAEDSFLVEEGLVKGSMQVLDTEGATRLYARMGQARETSGGSAANTMAGVAALGCRAGFVGQIADDQLGEIFSHDIRALGVEFNTPAKADGLPTGRCLILITPDAQRTMSTYRGASHELSADVLDPEQIRGAAILYLEAYLWRSVGPRAAMADVGDRDAAIEAIQSKVPLLVVTCGEEGALAVERGRRVTVPIARIGAGVVDTTGAGDLFAAGFLVGQTTGRSLKASLRLGAIAAAEVISHFGSRPEKDLKDLVAQL